MLNNFLKLKNTAGSFIKKLPVSFFCLALALLLYLTMPLELISLSSAKLFQGQFWRLFTAHLAHTNLKHLILDSIAFLIVSAFTEPSLGSKRYFFLLTILALAASLFFVVLYPTASGSGLSAITHGLVGFLLLRFLKIRDYLLAVLIILFLTFKFVSETSSRQSIFDSLGPDSMGIVASKLHLATFLAGFLLGLLILKSNDHIRGKAPIQNP